MFSFRPQCVVSESSLTSLNQASGRLLLKIRMVRRRDISLMVCLFVPDTTHTPSPQWMLSRVWYLYFKAQCTVSVTSESLQRRFLSANDTGDCKKAGLLFKSYMYNVW